MRQVRFTPRANGDLKNIAEYTLRVWGATQADRYLDGIELHCRDLSNNPSLGRPCDHLRPGLRRSEHGKHVIFYRLTPDADIIVSRILHQDMQPDLHALSI